MNDSLTVLVAYLNGPNPDRVINSNHSKNKIFKVITTITFAETTVKRSMSISFVDNL